MNKNIITQINNQELEKDINFLLSPEELYQEEKENEEMRIELENLSNNEFIK